MGKPIPDAASVAKKWVSRAGAAQSEYVDKVKQSTWKAEAAAGEDNYAKAVQDAIAKKKRLAGINKTSDQAWQDAVSKKAGRFSEGVQGAESSMSEGIGAVLNDIKSAMPSLDKRGPKGSPGNYNRSAQLGKALHDAAEKRKGA